MIRYILTNFFNFPCSHCDSTRDHFEWWWLEMKHSFFHHTWIGRKYDNTYYFIKDWISPYNVIKLRGLNKHWHDTDDRMFHAVFELLCQYIERECPFGSWDDETLHIKDNIEGMRALIEDWLGPNGTCAKEEGYHSCFPESQYKAALEALELYDWYLNKYEIERKTLEDSIFLIDYGTSEKSFNRWGVKRAELFGDEAETKRITPEVYWKMEEDFLKRCDDQMIRCVKARHSMWT